MDKIKKEICVPIIWTVLLYSTFLVAVVHGNGWRYVQPPGVHLLSYPSSINQISGGKSFLLHPPQQVTMTTTRSGTNFHQQQYEGSHWPKKLRKNSVAGSQQFLAYGESNQNQFYLPHPPAPPPPPPHHGHQGLAAGVETTNQNYYEQLPANFNGHSITPQRVAYSYSPPMVDRQVQNGRQSFQKISHQPTNNPVNAAGYYESANFNSVQNGVPTRSRRPLIITPAQVTKLDLNSPITTSRNVGGASPNDNLGGHQKHHKNSKLVKDSQVIQTTQVPTTITTTTMTSTTDKQNQKEEIDPIPEDPSVLDRVTEATMTMTTTEPAVANNRPKFLFVMTTERPVMPNTFGPPIEQELKITEDGSKLDHNFPKLSETMMTHNYMEDFMALQIPMEKESPVEFYDESPIEEEGLPETSDHVIPSLAIYHASYVN